MKVYFPKEVIVGMALLLVTFTMGACDKKKSCYDEALFKAHKNQMCTADCPGVKGCDGKVYCNECEANRHGIRVED